MPSGHKSNVTHWGSGGKSELNLFRIALNKGFKITDEQKERAIELVTKILLDPMSKRREVLSAARFLAVAEKINVDILLKLIDKESPDKIELTDKRSVDQMKKDPQFIEFLRDKAAQKQKEAISHGNGHHRGNGAAEG